MQCVLEGPLTADPEMLTSFYEAIGFKAGERAAIAVSEMTTLGLDGSGWRRSMTLGESRLDLEGSIFRGDPIPQRLQHAILYSSIWRSLPAMLRRRGGVRRALVRRPLLEANR